MLSLKMKNRMIISEILASTSTSIHWTRVRILDRTLEMPWLVHRVKAARVRSTLQVLL